MLLDRLQGNNGYFSQAVSEYAKKMKPQEEKKESSEGKTIGEFSEKEWDKLLEKVDNAIEEYREDIEKRKEDALEKQKEQTETYVLGNVSKQQQEYERSVLQNGTIRSMRFMKINGSTNSEKTLENKKPEIMDTISDELEDELIQKLIGNRGKAPYSALADENGMITYHGVVFQCDYENNRLCLGDVSNPNNCLTIPLEKGGCLVVNRDDIDSLIDAIDMFSPKDINRIMRAIAQDSKLRQVEQQIEDKTSGLEVLDKKEEGEHESKK